MKKSILSLVLFSLLISTPQIAQPNISSKVVLPVSIVLTIASGIATTYCYKQEKNILEELDKLKLTAEEIEHAVIATTPSEIAALKELMEQKKAHYQKGKWICGGLTLASLITAVISGVKTYRQSRQTGVGSTQQQTNPEDITEQEQQARLQQKIVAGEEIQASLKLLKDKLLEAETINLRLKNELATLKQDVIEKIDRFHAIQVSNALANDALTPAHESIEDYRKNAKMLERLQQIADEFLPEQSNTSENQNQPGSEDD